MRYATIALAALVAAVLLTSGALAEKQLASITATISVELTNISFTTGGDTWITPAQSSYGVYAVNHDSIDTSWLGNPGGKLHTDPSDGGPYYDDLTHVVGPYFSDAPYYLFSGTGPDFLGNYVALRMGTADTPLTGLRFTVDTNDYFTDQLHCELWHYGLGIEPVLVERFAPNQYSVRDYSLAGGSLLEFRLGMGPAVPEPSGLAVLLPACGMLALRLRRR